MVIGILRQFWYERLTIQGRYVAVGTTSTLIAAVLPNLMVGSLMFSVLGGFFALSLTISIFLSPRVNVQRRMPSRCMAGAWFIANYHVTNNSKRRVYNVGAYEFKLPKMLRIDEVPQYEYLIESGKTVKFNYTIHAQRRGSYLLNGATALSAFPLGLSNAICRSRQSDRLVVYPAFKPLTQLDIPSGLRYQPGGLALINHLGESMEFISNREYQPGDRARDLHARASARTGVPIVRQYAQEYLTRIAMIVDTHTTEVNSDELEANLSLAAAVADYLARQEYIVDLFAAGPDLYHYHSGESLAYLESIFDVLACIERCPDDPLEKIGPVFHEQLRQTSTVISLMLSWDDRRIRFIESIRGSGVQVRTIVVTKNREEMEAARNAGVIVLTADDIESGVKEL